MAGGAEGGLGDGVVLLAGLLVLSLVEMMVVVVEAYLWVELELNDASNGCHDLFWPVDEFTVQATDVHDLDEWCLHRTVHVHAHPARSSTPGCAT